MSDNLTKRLSSPYAVCALACFCCLLWGSAFPVIKIGYALLGVQSDDYMSQILFAGIRFTLAGLLTLLFGSIASKSVLGINKSRLQKASVLALFQTVLQYIFFYIGLAGTTGTKGSILNSVSVFFSVIIASLILKQERLTVNKMIGCAAGFAGVVIINLSGGAADMTMSFKGEGFIILSSLSYAVSSVLIKRYSQSENPVALSGYQFALGGAVMTVTGLLFGGRLHFDSIRAALLLVYLSLLSAVAYTLWGILLKYNPVSRVTVFGFMTPIFGCILSALLLKENLADSGIKTIFALALVCVGIFLVNKEKKHESKNDTCKGV